MPRAKRRECRKTSNKSLDRLTQSIAPDHERHDPQGKNRDETCKLKA